MTSYLKKIIKLWDKFWFAPVDLIGLSLFRLVFGFGLLVFYGVRFIDYRYVFSEAGILPYKQSIALMPEMYQSWIPWQWPMQFEPVAVILNIVFLLGVFGIAVGWIGRRGTWLFFLLHLSFISRNWSVLYGPDLVVTFWFFYLCFARTTDYLVWRPWAPKASRKKSVEAQFLEPVLTRDWMSSIACRFFQLQLCVIYAYSGLDKARGLPWWQGDAVWDTFANAQLATSDFSFIHHIPAVIAAMTFATLLWEVYFICLVWVKPLRNYCLIFGIMLHFGIGAVVGLWFFSYFMVISYLHFMDPTGVRLLLARIKQGRLGRLTRV